MLRIARRIFLTIVADGPPIRQRWNWNFKGVRPLISLGRNRSPMAKGDAIVVPV